MEAYAPTSIAVPLQLGAVFLVIAVWVAGVNRWSTAAPRAFFALSWILTLVQLVGVDRLLDAEPTGLRMVGLIATTLLAMKAITLAVRRGEGMAPLGAEAFGLFAFGWVGMEPRAFARRGAPRAAGIVWPRQGVILVSAVLAYFLARTALPRSPFLAGLAIMLAASLLLHFTCLRLLAAGLRRRGYAVREPFDRPLLSESLAEFWGRRWNRPFVELGSLAVFRPLQRRWGRGVALATMFLVSGLLHEMAISLPVRSHFGGPLAYFVLHGGLVLGEEWLGAKGRKVGGVLGRLWTVAALLIPLPILFHPPFLDGVLLPLL